MPIAPTYPGVYVEELPSGVHTITGVSTAVTAFLGYFVQGPMNTPVQIFSVADLQRSFGPLVINSEAGYGIQQFFANGGAEAWVVRVAASTTANPLGTAAIEMLTAPSGGTGVLTASASSPGSWGNSIRLAVDYNTTTAGTGFNLTVTQVDSSSPPNTLATEVYRNLVLDPTSSSYAPAVVNAASALIQLAAVGSPTATAVPAQTGTVSAAISTTPSNLSTLLSALPGAAMQVQLGGTTIGTVTYPSPTPASPPANLTEVASTLQGLLQALGAPPAIPDTTVSLIPGTASTVSLQISTVSSTPSDTLAFIAPTGGGDNMADTLLLDSPAVVNVQQYALGGSAAAAQAVPTEPAGVSNVGGDGEPPTGTDGTALIGNSLAKTGIYALDNAPGFNILCLPDVMNLSDTAAFAVISAAETYCQGNYAFLIVDPPQVSANRDTMTGIQDWIAQNATLRSSYAALYFPRPQIPDPLNAFRLRAVAPSGTLAGLYAQTDGTRGVWKAPAGTAAVLANVAALTYVMNNPENGVLNPLGINCLRSLPVYGNVSWGARTLDGADQLESQWKYLSVRRLALYIEASLYQGTQWVVFEPNDEPLWSQIRLNIGTFMQQLFQQGAFQGTTPASAYFVKCDSQTTTQADIDQGVVNIVVGFAPLLPAEFVVLQIQQIAGQSPS
ncbi:MAG TPA: phage tail sheath C-terminal domain-containing protein [Mycobacterium sp.]|nr:phage tail sheath C-terminal domain-containing protein [Mycobacterium sp.]